MFPATGTARKSWCTFCVSWLDTFEENVRSGNIMDANDAMVMKALVDEIIVNDTGIEIHCKCGVTIEQEYIK